MINGDITVKGSNNMIKALITSSLIMGLLMGFTLMTLAYGESETTIDSDFVDRLISINEGVYIFSCLNNPEWQYKVEPPKGEEITTTMVLIKELELCH